MTLAEPAFDRQSASGHGSRPSWRPNEARFQDLIGILPTAIYTNDAEAG